MKSNFVSFLLLAVKNQKHHLKDLLQKTAVGYFVLAVGCCAAPCIWSQEQMSDSEKLTAGWKIPFEGSRSNPVLAGGVLYVGSEDGAVYALDPKNGVIKWHFQTGERKVDETPVVENGTVFVGPEDYSFYAIDAVTGEKKWSIQTVGVIYEKAIVQNGIVFFVCSQGYLYAIDALTGQMQWYFETLKGMHISAKRSPSEPILNNGVIYLTNWPHHQMDAPHKSFLYAIDTKSGQLKWEFSIDGNDIHAPTVAGGQILISAYSDETRDLSNFYSVDAISGKMKWEFQATTGDANTRAFAVLDMALFGTEHGMYAVDLETGTLRWSRVEDERGGMILVDSLLYWTTIRGALHVLDPVTGKDKWSFTYGDGGLGMIIIAAVRADKIYASKYKKLYCLNRETGEELWSFNMETGHGGRPLIANGMVFITTKKGEEWRGDQGYFYAIDAITGEIQP